MTDITFQLKDRTHLQAAGDWVHSNLTSMLGYGPAQITLGKPKRSNPQNKKQWPMLEDIRKHIPVYHGHKMTTDDWKDVLTAAWGEETILPGINGGFVQLGVRTSKLNKKDFSDLIEFYYYFGTQKDVKWSESALELYEKYKQAGE